MTAGPMGTIAWFLMALGFALIGIGLYLYRRGAFSHDVAFVDVGGRIIAFALIVLIAGLVIEGLMTRTTKLPSSVPARLALLRS